MFWSCLKFHLNNQLSNYINGIIGGNLNTNWIFDGIKGLFLYLSVIMTRHHFLNKEPLSFSYILHFF